MPIDATWFNDPANWVLPLAFLIALLFVLLALKPRERKPAVAPVVEVSAEDVDDVDAQVADVKQPVAAAVEEPEPRDEANPAFVYLTQNGVSRWNAAREKGEHRDVNFSDQGGDFQTNAQGSSIWGTPGDIADKAPRLVLRRVDLARADLRGCDLRRADLRHAILINAKLMGANLERALLSNANLAHADLSGANLTDAVLADAYLAGANLHDAKVAGANFSWSNLRDAILDRSEIEEQNLYGARLANATFDGQKARWLMFGRNLLSGKPILARRRPKT